MKPHQCAILWGGVIEIQVFFYTTVSADFSCTSTPGDPAKVGGKRKDLDVYHTSFFCFRAKRNTLNGVQQRRLQAGQ